ncbi:extracellular calcium-sensing receptor-like protein, partial [Lates japonicus]
MALLKLVLLALLIRKVTPVCRLQGMAQPPELTKDGDFILGGIFTFRTGYRGSVPTFQSLPDPPTCLNINVREFKFAQTMIFAIEEINQNAAMLPNHTLGYKIYNSCGMTNIMKAAIDLASGQREIIDERNCTKADTAQAVLGHSGSAPTVGFARIIGRFQIPV